MAAPWQANAVRAGAKSAAQPAEISSLRQWAASDAQPLLA